MIVIAFLSVMFFLYCTETSVQYKKNMTERNAITIIYLLQKSQESYQK